MVVCEAQMTRTSSFPLFALTHRHHHHRHHHHHHRHHYRHRHHHHHHPAGVKVSIWRPTKLVLVGTSDSFRGSYILMTTDVNVSGGIDFGLEYSPVTATFQMDVIWLLLNFAAKLTPSWASVFL